MVRSLLIGCVAALALAACQAKNDTLAPPAAPPAAPAPAPSPAPAPAAAPAGKGTISGEVTLTGTPPVMEPLKRGADPICAKTAMNDESALVKDGKIENVVLRVKGAPTTPPPATPIEVDQKDCMYRPRVQAGTTGQYVRVCNDDGTLHNVHAYEGTTTLFNQAQPPGSQPIEKSSPAKPQVVKLKCDVHPWMTGFVVLGDSPYFAVTKADGKFEIPGVPAGTYTLEAWHEKFGAKSVQVTVTPNETAKAAIAYSADDRG
jgi:hypothetical protein